MKLTDDSDATLDRMRVVTAQVWCRAHRSGVSPASLTGLYQHGGIVRAGCLTAPPEALIAIIEQVLAEHGLELYDCEVQS